MSVPKRGKVVVTKTVIVFIYVFYSTIHTHVDNYETDEKNEKE